MGEEGDPLTDRPGASDIAAVFGLRRGQLLDTRVHYRLPGYGKMLCGARPPGFFTDDPAAVSCPECHRLGPVKGQP